MSQLNQHSRHFHSVYSPGEIRIFEIVSSSWYSFETLAVIADRVFNVVLLDVIFKLFCLFITTRISRNAVSRLPALFHKTEVNL